MSHRDCIAAIATAPGRGGIGVIRLSGSRSDIARIASGILQAQNQATQNQIRSDAPEATTTRGAGASWTATGPDKGALPAPRRAALRHFVDAAGEPIDTGIALYFPAPHSFTGEAVLELQGHGGPVVMDVLLERVLALGARLARPGEFSERAFLEGRLDLAQAEAIADLIDSGTRTQARLATRTLQGQFSARVDALLDALIRIRVFIEAALDFPEEEIDFLADSQVLKDLEALITQTQSLLVEAHRGERIRDGLLVVIAGAPNAGKSSLMNALAGSDLAIVTEIPGTTRDLLRADLEIDGLPLRLVDTAGLRLSTDPIEREGIRRARAQLDQADLVLWLIDDSRAAESDSEQALLIGHTDDRKTTGGRESSSPASELSQSTPITTVRNKIDLSGRAPGIVEQREGRTEIHCSALTGAGIELLRDHLKARAGFEEAASGNFSARRRHLDALRRTLDPLMAAREALTSSNSAELAAEDLRQAQQTLGEITGAFTTDDLLGRIFSDFCIGK